MEDNAREDFGLLNLRERVHGATHAGLNMLLGEYLRKTASEQI